ncbi:MAG: T9SS type A sorting domain-containing protein [Bacteroidales bacterium]|nr:T9SS type A sorting domain-containing protein [Bacteroidales bacterium]
MLRNIVCLLIVVCIGSRVDAQFSPAAGQIGSSAIHMDSSCFVSWAVNCNIQRGYVNISDTTFAYNETVFASYGADSDAIGKPNGQVVSLGDGGVALLEFVPSIANGPSWDFAVFENALTDVFLELAFVEISSDGENFFRFSATSLTPTDVQTGPFGNTNPEKINNLAGKYRTQYGTPFDLEELPDNPLLDKNDVRFVRLIDVVGSINPDYATYDSHGDIINDPWPTAFNSSGFDLDGIGVINNSLNTSITEVETNSVNVFPNPSKDILNIVSSEPIKICLLIAMDGSEIIRTTPSSNTFSISLNGLHSATYTLVLISNYSTTRHRVIKI